jgi:hypothetical protein
LTNLIARTVFRHSRRMDKKRQIVVFLPHKVRCWMNLCSGTDEHTFVGR